MPIYKHGRWGWGAFAVLWGCAVGLLWSWVVWTWDLAVLGMLTRYPYRALCVQGDSARKWSTVVWKWHLGTVRFDPDQARQRVWAEFRYFPKCMDIGDAECMVLFYLFGRSLFLWLFMVYDRLCGCVPCLRYPPKGETTSGILLLLLLWKHSH